MNTNRLGVAAVMVVVACTACTSESVESEAPEATVDSLAESDWGTNWNGWTQNFGHTFCSNKPQWTLTHTLTRSFGDTTRGGGACLIIDAGNSCTGDNGCTTTAQSLYGSDAVGYCFNPGGGNGWCYARPGSQASFCALGPNRSPGTISKVGNQTLNRTYGFVGCVTKTGGPNPACGGSDPSLYVRQMVTTPTMTTCP